MNTHYAILSTTHYTALPTIYLLPTTLHTSHYITVYYTTPTPHTTHHTPEVEIAPPTRLAASLLVPALEGFLHVRIFPRSQHLFLAPAILFRTSELKGGVVGGVEGVTIAHCLVHEGHGVVLLHEQEVVVGEGAHLTVAGLPWGV
jgi:hypothetical protein